MVSCSVLSLLSESSHLIGRHSAVQIRPHRYIYDSKESTGYCTVWCLEMNPLSHSDCRYGFIGNVGQLLSMHSCDGLCHAHPGGCRRNSALLGRDNRRHILC